MGTVFSHMGRTLWYALLFMFSIVLLTIGGIFGEQLIFNRIGDTPESANIQANAGLVDRLQIAAENRVSTDGFTMNGEYIDSASIKSLQLAKPTIELTFAPELNKPISLSQLFSVKDSDGTELKPEYGNQNVGQKTYYVVSVADEYVKSAEGAVTDTTGVNNSIKEGKVIIDNNGVVTFTKQGTYRFNLRLNGTAVSRKSYVITVR